MQIVVSEDERKYYNSLPKEERLKLARIFMIKCIIEKDVSRWNI